MVAGSYVQCASKGAGKIYENRWMMDLMKNTKQRKLGVNLNYAAKCVIKKRKNFAFVPDVFVRNIVHGMGTTFYGPEDLTSRCVRACASVYHRLSKVMCGQASARHQGHPRACRGVQL